MSSSAKMDRIKEAVSFLSGVIVGVAEPAVQAAWGAVTKALNTQIEVKVSVGSVEAKRTKKPAATPESTGTPSTPEA